MERIETRKGITVHLNVNGISDDKVKRLFEITDTYRNSIMNTLCDVDPEDIYLDFDMSATEYANWEASQYRRKHRTVGY